MTADKSLEKSALYVATQLKRTASAENSAWIVGRATFTEEIVNGPMKDVRVATKSADFSKDLSAGNSYLLQIH